VIVPASRRFRPVWRGAGYLCFAVGAVGAAVPLLPTVGPWILAVWCLWKGDDPLARRLIQHPKAGPHLKRWFEHGVISRWSKIAATLGMAAGVVTAAFAGLGVVALALLTTFLAAVSVWLWLRPERSTGQPPIG
jgi:uncharacterized membrane protein YbaN (DUF454 family)